MGSNHPQQPLSRQQMADDIARKMPSHDELDKRVFQLNILYQSAKELADHADPKELAKAFLLNSMGSVGAGMGFLVLKAPDWEEGIVATLGLDPEARHRLESILPSSAFPIPDDAPAQPVQVLMRDAPSADKAYPRETAIVFGWKSDSGIAGLLGLGQRISGLPYDAEATDFLQNLLHTFAQALNNAVAGETISLLNRNLLDKNLQLELALHQAKEAQVHLDRRIFHLHTLYDTSLELSLLHDVKPMLDTFSLLLQGAFSLEGVCILLYDQRSEELLQTLRGDVTYNPGFTVEQTKTLLFKSISASAFERLQPLSAQFLAPEVFAEQPPSLPFSIRRALLFRVDDHCLGLLFLGAKLTQEEVGEEEAGVLLTLVHNFLVFLEKARSFEIIQRLNQNLNARNVELQTTLDELTASRGRIEVLERAGAKLRSILQLEAERIGRFSKWDFAWLFAASLLLGLLFNASNPNGVDLVPEVMRHSHPPMISQDQARELLKRGAVLVDARPAAFYEQGHIEGSVNMPPTLFDFIYSMRFGELDLDAPIVVYGRTFSRLYDAEVAQRLKTQGHESILILESWTEGRL